MDTDSVIPPLPEGFSLDQQSSVPPLPDGFTLDNASNTAPIDNSFSARVGQDLEQRKNQAARAISEGAEAGQPLPVTGARLMGTLAGAGMDIGREAIPQSLKDTASSVGNVVSRGAQKAADYLDKTAAGQAAGNIGMQGMDALSDMAKAHPVAMHTVTDIANVIPAEAGIRTAADIAGAIGEKGAAALARPVGKFPGTAIPEKLPPISADKIKAASQNAYKYAEDTGGTLAPDTFVNDIRGIIQNAKAKPIPGIGFTPVQAALNTTLDAHTPSPGAAWGLQDFENYDKSLTAAENAAMDGYKPTNNSRIIGQVQDAVRARLKALKPEDVIGGTEGFDALTQHAIPLWSTQTKMRDLQNIIDRANYTKNPAQAMQTAFKNLATSPKINAYPAQVQALIRKGASGGNLDDWLGIWGSRLNPITNSTLTGKVLNTATSGVFRNIKNNIQNKKADDILSALTEPVRASVERFSSPVAPAVSSAGAVISPETASAAASLGIDTKNKTESMVKNDINAHVSKSQYFDPQGKGVVTKNAETPSLTPDADEKKKEALEYLSKSQYFKSGGKVNTKPSDAQIKAGNYAKGHLTLYGLDISIETPKGAIRRGTDKNGKKWQNKSPADYGYIRNSVSNDGEHVDCYVGPNRNSKRVWVIDQKHHDSGLFDEHKIMLGFKNKGQALATYRKGFSDGKADDRIQAITECTLDELKDWLKQTKKDAA